MSKYFIESPGCQCDNCELAFSSYVVSLDRAAREIANTPAAAYCYSIQEDICRKYGIFLNNITEDEKKYLQMQVNEYVHRY